MEPPEMSDAARKLRAWAEIDLGRLERNLANIKRALPDHLKFIAVIKADAYGHGLAPVATRLMRAGADMFAVANLEEASALREIGTGWPILVLSAILPTERPDIFTHNVIPTVSSLEEAKALAELARVRSTTLGIHLKIDTGMARLGIWHTEAVDLFKQILRLPELRLEGIYTHFACADSDPEVTRAQRDTFLALLSQLPAIPGVHPIIHADNSAGIESFPANGPLTGARIGLLQFGVLPYAGSFLANVPVEPVFSFHARVGLIKQLPKGTPVSYGHTHALRRDTRLGILTAGYADGIPTRMSNRGHALVGGQRCPILGRVTMDQTLVDLTDAPPEVEPGMVATFIGKQGGETLKVEGFAAAAEQVPWETFCSVSKRVHRLYRLDSAL